MQPPRSESSKHRLRILLTLLLIGYGLVRVFYFAFAQPPGNGLDRALLYQIGIGCFYVFSGIWIYLENPGFTAVSLIMFAIFMLEISQIAIY